MRRLTLAVFFALAACGGAVKPSTNAVDPATDMRAEAQRYLLTAEAQVAISVFAKSFSQDAIDSCLAAWVDDFGGPGLLDEPISKPDVKGLRNFLAQCLGGSVPGDQRTAPDNLRTVDPGNRL